MPIVTLDDLRKKRGGVATKGRPLQPCDASEEEFIPSENEEEEDEEEKEEKRLGNPDIEEEEIESDMEEYEEQGTFMKRKRSITMDEGEVAGRVQEDPQYAKQRRHSRKRYVAWHNRHTIDGQDTKNKNDDEIDYVADWSKDDPGAKYHLKPDDAGDFVEVEDGVFKRKGRGRREIYKRADTVVAEDSSFAIEPLKRN